MPSLRARRRSATTVSLRSRVMLLAMAMVELVVVLVAFAVYQVISAALYQDIDHQLERQAQLLSTSGLLETNPEKAIEGTTYSNIDVMLVLPNGARHPADSGELAVPVGAPEQAVIHGQSLWSWNTIDDQRIFAIRRLDGSALLLSMSLAPTDAVISRLRWLLLAVGTVGVAVAAVAGWLVMRAGLRPVGRLTEAAERVARTDDLRPIPVSGDDELSRLTEAFNMMLRALAESRDRQARLVADAGHELRTPLTSLRTNVELLMASMKPGAPRLPEHEIADLRHDAVAQIEELSTLIGDLIDLSRDDSSGPVHEPVDLTEVVDRCLERVRRRRNDIEFDVDIAGWQLDGDAAGLSRAVLNLLDNAAKWSPPGGQVGVRLAPAEPGYAELVVADRGPGIPEAERALVFERFYRSTDARAMPGSGLGLAIVKQVILRHGGSLRIEDTVPGGQPPGTSIHLRLPGRQPPGEEVAGNSADGSHVDPKRPPSPAGGP
ncbi:HAMP domain-containing sensor histidine kinase [Mycobacterium sp. 1274756.6]|uniref:HAMP domain-containing sensor histidine kinase n=1 Tax=Mycobacterium sp. 1274756.6 TaxID=1834076 RepID=UPI0009EF1984|nr:HAMP domain-containing sensor histidine kinase [Mycobacterium sp. 1274756.6]